MKKHIIIEISPYGETTIEAVGFKGQACQLATRALEQALGTIRDSKKKPEYYQHEERPQKVQQ
jgi:hypothetical protein